ncbi:MAG: Ig-like domain-containing protein [Bacteroidetes bacterium]|nr:Ig-like domain-containing protein [Bacteroidota bacterium]
MKKIKNKLLLIIMVLSGFFIQGQPIQMTIPDASADVGDNLIIPVNVDNSLTGFDVLSYQFRIYFNSTRLSLNSIDVAGTMSSSWSTPVYNNSEPNYVNIANAGSTALTGTGILFNLNFTCIGAGATWISFDGDEVNNYFNEGYPPMLYDDGYITVIALPTINISPDNGLLAVGEQLQFSVSGGTAPYSWDVTDPGVASIVSNGPSTAMLTALSQGFTKVNVEDDNGIIDETTDFIEVRALKLTIPDTSEWQGGTIDIPVYTTSVNGLGILSGDLSFTFNGNILYPTGINKTGTLLETYSNIEFNNTTHGALSVSFAGTTPLTGGGVLFFIQFDISAVNSGNTWIYFQNALFNETIPAKTDDGLFSMITFGNITISPNTYTIVAGETNTFTASGGVPPYTWSSSDPTVGSVNSSGLLTAHKSGIIQLTATDDVGAFGTSGNIAVYDTYVTIPSVNSTLGSIYDIPVAMGSLPSGQEVLSIQGTISFKTPELTAIDIITAGTMTDGWNFAKVISGNTISFAGAGTTSFNSPGTMFKVRFQLNPELTVGEFAYVNFSELLLNEGIPLPLLQNGGITGSAGYTVNLKVFMEGPYNTSTDLMETTLNSFNYIPLAQPFNPSLPYYDNASPVWRYTGSESVGAIPANVTDWVLVQLRDATSPANATSATIVEQKAAFVLNTGVVVGLNGIDPLLFTAAISENLYVVIFHRNHLGVISASELTLSGGSYSWDFTTGSGQAYGGINGHKQLEPGVWGMISADGNGNGLIQNTDETAVWKVDLGQSGYKGGDFNLNGLVQNTDETNYWKVNLGAGGQTPGKSNNTGYQSQVPE